MLRELSLKAKRRTSRAEPPTPRESDATSTASQKSPPRGLSSLPRRLSRGTASFHRSNSFLSRYRSSSSTSAASSQRPTRTGTASEAASSPPQRKPVDSPPSSPAIPTSTMLHRDRRHHLRSSTNTRTEPPVPRKPTPPLEKKQDPQPQPPSRSFPRKPGLTNPLVSVDDLMRWRPTGLAARCVSTVPLSDSAIKRFVRGVAERASYTPPALPAPPPHGEKSTSNSPVAARGAAGSLKRLQPPRLLVCHDFRDGYQPWEANASGAFGNDCPEDTDMWRFNHWAYVDVFVYFSHYRVTIPPVGYIHAAHRHGALALGTVIFEWEQGAADLEKVLASYKTRSKAASQLAAIAKFYGFDGWLLNVEVALLGGSSAASDLASFVGDLTRATRKVVGPVSEVIWYDSVTRDGSLKWQNELNADNEQFFKAAGSIFTNYHWDRNAPVRSAVKAGTRRTDVFTGIDTHGRNTFGGGGFHTHIALRAIKQGGTSAAVFAPAWTVEKCPPNVSDPRELEERFWTGPSGRFGRECVAQYFRERPVVTDLPFSTSFDPGWGPRLMRNGNVKDSRRYFNMAQQSVQPSFMRTVVAAGDTAAAELSMSTDQAYNGSTSVKVSFAFSESRMLTGSFSVMRLFISSVVFPARLSSRITKSSAGAMRVTYNYYAESDTNPDLAADDFGLALMMSSPTVVILLVGSKSKWNMSKAAQRALPRMQMLGKFVDIEVVVADSDRRALGSPSAVDGATGWKTRSFVLPPSLTSAQRLAEVMVITGGPPEQPVSVRPSPFMTPSVGSRTGSRLASTTASRLASRETSRASSPTRGERRRLPALLPPPEDSEVDAENERMSQAGDREGGGGTGDAFGGALLSQFRESFGQKRLTYSRPTSHGNDSGVLGAGFDRRQESAPMRMGRGVEGDSRDEGQVSGTGGRNMSLPRSGLRALAHGSMNMDGDVDFARMEMEDDMQGNRTIGRFGNRLATPMSSRPGSRFGSRLNSVAGSRNGSLAHSLAGSRAGSIANSRMGSRMGSQQTSRFASPSRTPQAGGGGALPLEKLRDAGRTDKPGIMSPGFRSREGSGLESGTATPGQNVTALKDLKSALMHAAGSMAGEVPAEEGGRPGGSVKTVYLGGLHMELLEPDEGKTLPAAYSGLSVRGDGDVRGE